MTTDCPICKEPFTSHALRYSHWTERFSLDCGQENITSLKLGPTEGAVRATLRRYYDDETAEALWDAFGQPGLWHQVFRVGYATHTAEDPDCWRCPVGWPVACTEHGGCDGLLHLTLSRKKSDKIYSRRSQLPADKLRAAYRNLIPRRHEPAAPTPYETSVTCSHCGSGPALREVQRALADVPMDGLAIAS